MRAEAILKANDLVVEYRTNAGTLKAVSGVSLDICKGETLGIVGESGCGKSTLARAMMQLPKPTSGSVKFNDKELTVLNPAEVRDLRSEIQLIFQNPIAALNPRRTARRIVAEGFNASKTQVSKLGVAVGVLGFIGAVTMFLMGKPLAAGVAVLVFLCGFGWALRSIARPKLEPELLAKVDQTLKAVGLDPKSARFRRPHQYSGGQCQRISLARALVLEPSVLICDEPVSALDVSVQAQVLNLLEDMKDRYGLTMVFISHDLSVIGHISDRIAVMYLGKLCEIGDSRLICAEPAHPYTKILLSSLGDPTNPHFGQLELRDAELPSPLDPPSGCRFRTRCPYAQPRCAQEQPEFERVGHADQWVACHFPLKVQ